MSDLGRIIKQQRVMRGLTLEQLSAMSGVSGSYQGRIENGDRSPSAGILRKIAEPLGFSVGELLTFAGYLPSEPSIESEAHTGRIDPYVARVLSEEPIEIQRYVVTILSVLKSVAKAIK